MCPLQHVSVVLNRLDMPAPPGLQAAPPQRPCHRAVARLPQPRRAGNAPGLPAPRPARAGQPPGLAGSWRLGWRLVR